MLKREEGFTLIELGVSMAVAVLMLVISAGLFSMSRNQRFSESINKTKNFIQRQYNDVLSGFNSRNGGRDFIGCESDNTTVAGYTSVRVVNGGNATGNSRCYVIGRLIQFREKYMESYYIVVKPQSRDGDEFRCTNGSFGTCYDDNNIWPFPNTSPRGSIEQASEQGWLYVVGLNGESFDSGNKRQREFYGGGITLGDNYWIVRDRYDITKRTSDVKSVAVFRSPFDASITAYTNVRVRGNSLLLDRDNSSQSMVISLKSGSLPGLNSDAAICLSNNTLSSGIESASPVPPRSELWRICEGK